MSETEDLNLLDRNQQPPGKLPYALGQQPEASGQPEITQKPFEVDVTTREKHQSYIPHPPQELSKLTGSKRDRENPMGPVPPATPSLTSLKKRRKETPKLRGDKLDREIMKLAMDNIDNGQLDPHRRMPTVFDRLGPAQRFGFRKKDWKQEEVDYYNNSGKFLKIVPIMREGKQVNKLVPITFQDAMENPKLAKRLARTGRPAIIHFNDKTNGYRELSPVQLDSTAVLSIPMDGKKGRPGPFYHDGTNNVRAIELYPCKDCTPKSHMNDDSKHSMVPHPPLLNCPNICKCVSESCIKMAIHGEEHPRFHFDCLQIMKRVYFRNPGLREQMVRERQAEKRRRAAAEKNRIQAEKNRRQAERKQAKQIHKATILSLPPMGSHVDSSDESEDEGTQNVLMLPAAPNTELSQLSLEDQQGTHQTNKNGKFYTSTSNQSDQYPPANTLKVTPPGPVTPPAPPPPARVAGESGGMGEKTTGLIRGHLKITLTVPDKGISKWKTVELKDTQDKKTAGELLGGAQNRDLLDQLIQALNRDQGRLCVIPNGSSEKDFETVNWPGLQVGVSMTIAKMVWMSKQKGVKEEKPAAAAQTEVKLNLIFIPKKGLSGGMPKKANKAENKGNESSTVKQNTSDGEETEQAQQQSDRLPDENEVGSGSESESEDEFEMDEKNVRATLSAMAKAGKKLKLTGAPRQAQDAWNRFNHTLAPMDAMREKTPLFPYEECVFLPQGVNPEDYNDSQKVMYKAIMDRGHPMHRRAKAYQNTAKQLYTLLFQVMSDDDMHIVLAEATTTGNPGKGDGFGVLRLLEKTFKGKAQMSGREWRSQYDKLIYMTNGTFSDFKVKFVRCVTALAIGQYGIQPSTQIEDLVDKMPQELQSTCNAIGDKIGDMTEDITSDHVLWAIGMLEKAVKRHPTLRLARGDNPTYHQNRNHGAFIANQTQPNQNNNQGDQKNRGKFYKKSAGRGNSKCYNCKDTGHVMAQCKGWCKYCKKVHGTKVFHPATNCVNKAAAQELYKKEWSQKKNGKGPGPKKGNKQANQAETVDMKMFAKLVGTVSELTKAIKGRDNEEESDGGNIAEVTDRLIEQDKPGLGGAHAVTPKPKQGYIDTACSQTVIGVNKSTPGKVVALVGTATDGSSLEMLAGKTEMKFKNTSVMASRLRGMSPSKILVSANEVVRKEGAEKGEEHAIVLTERGSVLCPLGPIRNQVKKGKTLGGVKNGMYLMAFIAEKEKKGSKVSGKAYQKILNLRRRM